MASLIIHLLVGQEYCKRHPGEIKDEEAFLLGSLAPDMVKDKQPTHFSAKRIGNKTYTESIMNKVNLPLCTRNRGIDNDFDKGFFLHLITDHLFFYRYLLKEPRYLAIENNDQLEIHATLYRDYHRINNWLMNAHPDLKLDMLADEMKTTRSDALEIIDRKKLRKIIEVCADMDIEKAYEIISQIPLDNPHMEGIILDEESSM